MLMEIMGLHLPGASFVHPNTPLRDALTVEAVHRVVGLTAQGNEYTPLGRVIDERAVVNGVVGLHATGGSTNHLLHLVAIARAAGVDLRWDDFDELSAAVPLLARVYPNGSADVNHFHAAGGMGFLIGQLLDAVLLHEDVDTVFGKGLDAYRVEATLEHRNVIRAPSPASSRGTTVLRGVAEPFRKDGGLRVLHGNVGTSTIKISAVPEDRFVIEAPALVFDDQNDVQAAFERGELNRDFVAVVRFQGPRANGMPELHKLTPPLSVLQNRGHRVALVTDGRMSGASGKVPAAIHVTPEAIAGGNIGRIRNGDIVRLDAVAGTLEVKIDDATLNARECASIDNASHHVGLGRELFANFRHAVGTADRGASIFGEIA
jgi:phosphogluconate dehydratase